VYRLKSGSKVGYKDDSKYRLIDGSHDGLKVVGSWDENALHTNSFPNAKVKSKIGRKSKKYIFHTFPFRPTVI